MFPLGKFATKELFLGMQSSLRRALSTSQKLMSQEWQQQGVPGSNLPFPINCRYKLTLLFTLFFGSALSAPFIIARRHLLLVNNKEPPVPPQELTTIICFDEKELKDVDSFPEDSADFTTLEAAIASGQCALNLYSNIQTVAPQIRSAFV